MARPSGADAENALLARLRASPALALLLDYDGTLVPFAKTPDRAQPDVALLELLRALARRPATHVHVVSGRTRESLVEFLGDLPIGLHGEHGLWSRPAGGAWTQLELGDTSWMSLARELVEDAAARTPGAFVERKVGGFSWHYRAADPELGPRNAAVLRDTLERKLAAMPAEVFAGDHVIEIRPRGIHKGRVVPPIAATLPAGAALLGMGDDRTDEDLLAAVSVRVRVGPRDGEADLWLPDPHAARAWLARLL
jgi:trehalose 6-phosphate synthase/phosphatase